MMIDMDEFFPCYKSWLSKLLKTVVSRSTDPDGHICTIRLYLQMRLELTQRWIREHTDGRGMRIGCTAYDFNKMSSNLTKLRGCLELIGGADGQHSDSPAGQEPARN